MKFATHLILFGNDKWVLKNIENVYPFVEKIYIAYSKFPWIYNPESRDLYTKELDLSFIKESIYYDKIEIIEGIFDTEEIQRNICLDKAVSDGMDFLYIIDSDEFYSFSDFEKMNKYINENSSYNIYRTSWINFWKELDIITIKENGEVIAGFPDVCVNLKKGLRFVNKRTVCKDNIGVIPDVCCFHMSYVLTDDEVKQKIETWGHTKDFDTNKWYQEKWLNWNEDSIGLHPIQPNAWYKAIKFTGELPEVLRK